MHINKPLPPQWANRKSISAKEYRDWLNGKIKAEFSKVKPGPKLRSNFRQDFATFQNGALTITIHELPPSQNQWKKWHWSVLAEETKRWNVLIMLLAMSTKCGKFKRPVIRFSFYFPDNINRDRKNFESWKPLLDGLTWARVIEDDNYKVIQEEKSEVAVDRRDWRTEIQIWEG